MITRQTLYDDDGNKAQLVTDELGDQSVTLLPSGRTVRLKPWSATPSNRLVRA